MYRSHCSGCVFIDRHWRCVAAGQSVEYMDKCPQIIAGEKPKSVKETRGRPMKETRNE